MKNIDYRRATLRHSHTCEKLLETITNETKSPNKQNILLNIYYLSGYIIETALSYCYFSHIKYSGHIEDSPEFKAGKFKTHNFDTKVKIILEKKGHLTGLPFISSKHSDKKLNSLYNNWSTDFRYCTNDTISSSLLTEDLLEKYLSEVKKISQIILSRY